NRTPDLWYRKPTLYPLSYEGGIPTPRSRRPSGSAATGHRCLIGETDRSTGAGRRPHRAPARGPNVLPCVRIPASTCRHLGYEDVTPAHLAAVIRAAVLTVLTERGADVSVVPDTVVVERPRNPEHGDYATNIALQLGKKVGAPPRELAQEIAPVLAEDPGVSSAEIAGPGFLN